MLINALVILLFSRLTPKESFTFIYDPEQNVIYEKEQSYLENDDAETIPYIVTPRPEVERFGEAIFLVGMLNLAIALFSLVRNFGMFKSFSYFAYRRYKKNLKNRIEIGLAPKDSPIMDFAEYTINKYEKQWDNVIFFLNCGILILIYAALYILFG